MAGFVGIRMPDDRIDDSDLPFAEFHEGRAVRGRFYKPIKQQITTRRVSGQRVYPLSFKNFLSELYELISRKLSGTLYVSISMRR